MEQGTGVRTPEIRLTPHLLEFALSANSRVLLQAPREKQNGHPRVTVLFLEQGTGVEPALTAWEAAVIPIYQPCVYSFFRMPYYSIPT